MICYCSSPFWGGHQDPHVEPIALHIECLNKGILKEQLTWFYIPENPCVGLAVAFCPLTYLKYIVWMVPIDDTHLSPAQASRLSTSLDRSARDWR